MSTARVDFTRGAAERIARVVRLVEQGDRDQAALRFRRVFDDIPGSTLRLGRFEGSWPLYSIKEVTLNESTATANVLNLTAPVTIPSDQELYVVFSKVKHTTDFVAVEIEQPQECMRIAGYDLEQIGGYSGSGPQILGHNGSCLIWYDVSTCPS